MLLYQVSYISKIIDFFQFEDHWIVSCRDMWSKNGSEIVPVWVTVNTNADYWSILYGPSWSRSKPGYEASELVYRKQAASKDKHYTGLDLLTCSGQWQSKEWHWEKSNAHIWRKKYTITPVSVSFYFKLKHQLQGLSWYGIHYKLWTNFVFEYTEIEKSFWRHFHQWLYQNCHFDIWCCQWHFPPQMTAFSWQCNGWQCFSEVPMLTMIYWVSNISIKPDHIPILSLSYAVQTCYFLYWVIS